MIYRKLYGNCMKACIGFFLWKPEPTRPTFFCSKSTKATLKKVGNMIKAKIKTLFKVNMRCYMRFGPFVKFKELKKHSWRSVSYRKVTGWGSNFTESNTPPLVFSIFFKFCKWYQIAQTIPYVQSVNMFSILKVKNKGIFNF